MSEITPLWRRRLKRLESLCGPVNVAGPAMQSDRPLVAVTSSRLGHDPRLHGRIGRFLCRTLGDCRQREADLLVGAGTAIEPWADRAAELLGVLCRKLVLDAADAVGELRIAGRENGGAISLDAAVIGLADRVDAVYVRRGGRIAMSLKQRLRTHPDGSVRVAVIRSPKCASQELIRSGAVGWIDLGIDPWQETHSWEETYSATLKPGQQIVVEKKQQDLWGTTEGQWLVHCTRGRIGPWPDETERQYRDAVLIGASSSLHRGPLQALLRIVRCGRLIASATASDHRYPVVCFSAQSLQQLMRRRCFRSHLGRWDYEPFGVALRLSAARSQGVQPVIYGGEGEREKLSEESRFRFHPRGTRYDWTEEQEWRSPKNIDLRELDPRDVRIFALEGPQARTALDACPWQVTYLRIASRADDQPSIAPTTGPTV